METANNMDLASRLFHRTLQGDRQQSQLRFRAFLHELLNVGFEEPLLVMPDSLPPR